MTKYRYKSVLISGQLFQSKIDKLNELYEQGWEYVDGVPQNVCSVLTSGSYNHETYYGDILVTLKKVISENDILNS